MRKNRTSGSGINIRQTTIHLTVLGILTALCIVIAMFTIRPSDSIKISLTFIPVVIAAYIYGPAGAGTVAGLADIIGCIIKPHGMIYPPITLTEIAVGIVFGLLLYKKWSFLRVLFSAGITQLVISAFVTPLWLYFLYGMNYETLLVTRIPQIIIMLTVELIVIPIMLKTMDRINVRRLISVGCREGSKKSESKK